MPNKKLFLVQFLIEADVSEWPDFDEMTAADHFLSALKLTNEDRKLGAQVYLLAKSPNERGDLLVEEYEDRGLVVQIFQDAHTVGTDAPTYFSTVWNPQAKGASSSASENRDTVEEAKEDARLRVDRRLARKPRSK